jgi:site-specific DNA-methyltransferase (adenine-specific)
LDGSPEVIDLFPESKGQQGDVRGTEASRTGGEGTNCYGEYGRIATPKRAETVSSAARFYHDFPPDPIICHPKAGKADRAGGKHPTVKPIALMQYLIRHITPPGGTVLDPFAGSGTTGEAAKREGFDCILMEAEPDYVEFLNSRFDLQPQVDDSQLVDTKHTQGEKELMDWLLSQI